MFESSQSTMEAGGTWTGQGYNAPWMHHSVAGQYTLLEKQLVSDLSPYRRRPVPRVLQDSTNWHDAQLPSRWSLLKQEGQWFSGKDLSRVTSSPKAQWQPPLPLPPQRSPTYGGLRPVHRRDGSWGAVSHLGRDGPTDFLTGGSFTATPSCWWYPRGASAKSRCDPPVRAPPSYEAHMLLRLRAGQGPRKENWPHPPPYVAPPSYEAPHCTVQPQQPPPMCQRPCKEALTGKQHQTMGPKKCGERIAGTYETRGPQSHGPGRKAGRRQAKIPGSWSYLSGASTWGGPRRQPERAESINGLVPSWDMSPQDRSYTLPRISKRNKGVPVACPPQHTLPAGLGFSHAVGCPPGAVGNGGNKAGDRYIRDLMPKWKEPSHTREAGGSQGSLSKLTPRRCGGLFVIDATCVVIQAHYIPAPRTEHVRYLGQEGLDKVKAAVSPGSPAPVSMEERAARILGLSVSELGFTEAGKSKILGPGSPRQTVSESSAAEVTVAEKNYGTGQPRRAPSSLASPRKALPLPTPNNFQVKNTQEELPCPEDTGASTVPCQESVSGLPQREEEPEPIFPSQRRSYALELKEAMSRIRRHTAPDSDTDEELEKECEPVCGQPVEWKGGMNEGALYCSSSSLDSSSSNATVVPGNSTPTPLPVGDLIQMMP
ncbi:dendrin isoform X2 [Sceloporus undulatus]|uniref:dendrin isoform X2 n=1 Tax=Sceloporus undulatus TaxID=8520 RepID=UPI001C4C858E|nr:dendrin isoform X2 [Sceloporus undulatus]